MAVNYPADHPLTLELLKWNKPYRYEEYPRTMYKAQTLPGGQASVSEVNDSLFGGTPGAAEAFCRSCQHTVRSDDEKQKALEAGWRITQTEAMEFRAAKDKAVADLTAVRHFEDRGMSDLARAEAAQADADSFAHVPEVPVKRRGRPKKVQPAA